MPGFYPKGRYDLDGFCVAVVDEGDLIDGRQIKTGDKIIGVASSGIHSNGFSLVRKVLSKLQINQKTTFGADNLPLACCFFIRSLPPPNKAFARI